MGVPFFDIHAAWDAGQCERLRQRWEAILAHGRFVNGPEIPELEAALAAFLGLPEVVACSNGSDALVLALRVAGVGPGDEVLVPAFTFFATAGAVVRLGARPVFCDIAPETFCLDPEDAARRAGPAVQAALPVHLYGRPCAVAPLREALREATGRDVAIVEDAAQAVGAVGEEGPCGGLGIAAGFSCFPTKNLGATGDAGFVTTRDAEAAQRMRRLREHGMDRRYLHEEAGWNFRMDSLQAASLLVALERLEAWTEERRAAARHYRELFAEAGLGPRVVVPQDAPGHVWHQFVLRVREDRDGLREALAEQGIGSAVYYPWPLHLQPCFAGLGGREGGLPESERAAKEVLALPIQPGRTAEDRVRVVEAIAAWVRSRS